MSHELSDSEYNREIDIEHRFKFKQRMTNDSRYGEFTILRNSQTGQLIMMKEKMLNAKDAISKEIIACKERMNLQSPF